MMDLDTLFLGNSILAWLTALGVALSINLVVGLVKYGLVVRLTRAVSNAEHVRARAIVDVARRTSQLLVFLVSAFVVTRYLDLPERVADLLRGAAILAAFLQIGLWAHCALQLWLGHYRERVVRSNIGATTSLGALGFVGQIVLWGFVSLLALSNLGVDVTALVAGLGIGGIAVALAVQNILGDLFASLSIVVDKPFVVGDFIIVDDYMGTVEYVGMKTTRIRSLGGEQIVFTNGDLLQARVRNYKRMYERRIVFTFGLVLQTPPEKLEKVSRIVQELVERQPLTRFDRAHFFKFGEYSLDYEVVFWMMDPDYNKYMDVQQAINLAMLRSFAEEGVRLAYPARALALEEPVTLGRLPRQQGERHDGPPLREPAPQFRPS